MTEYSEQAPEVVMGENKSGRLYSDKELEYFAGKHWEYRMARELLAARKVIEAARTVVDRAEECTCDDVETVWMKDTNALRAALAEYEKERG